MTCCSRFIISCAGYIIGGGGHVDSDGDIGGGAMEIDNLFRSELGIVAPPCTLSSEIVSVLSFLRSIKSTISDRRNS
jgi:hypothetical protein